MYSNQWQPTSRFPCREMAHQAGAPARLRHPSWRSSFSTPCSAQKRPCIFFAAVRETGACPANSRRPMTSPRNSTQFVRTWGAVSRDGADWTASGTAGSVIAFGVEGAGGFTVREPNRSARVPTTALRAMIFQRSVAIDLNRREIGDDIKVGDKKKEFGSWKSNRDPGQPPG